MSDYSFNTPEFTGAFLNVWEPRQKDDPADKDKYGISMLFDAGENLKQMKQLTKKLLDEKFGAGKHPKSIRMPWRDQDEKADEYAGFVSGALFCNASTSRQPGIVDNNVQDIMDQKQVYSGCRFQANVNLFYYDFKGNKGVAVGLNHLMKLADGEPLGGAAPAVASVFSPVEVDTSKSADAVFDEDSSGGDVDPFA